MCNSHSTYFHTVSFRYCSKYSADLGSLFTNESAASLWHVLHALIVKPKDTKLKEKGRVLHNSINACHALEVLFITLCYHSLFNPINNLKSRFWDGWCRSLCSSTAAVLKLSLLNNEIHLIYGMIGPMNG